MAQRVHAFESLDTMPGTLVPAGQAWRWLPVSRATVYAMVRRGNLRAVRIAGSLYVSRAEIQRVLDNGNADLQKEVMNDA